MTPLPAAPVKSSFILPLLLLVALPLVGLAWLGARMVGGERARLRESFQQILEQRAAEVNQRIKGTVEALELELNRSLNVAILTPETLREIPRNQRFILQVFALDARGRRTFPSSALEMQSTDEAAFLARTEMLWKNGERLNAATSDGGVQPQQGWYVWYHGSGARYLFWRLQEGGSIIGAEVPASVITAEIIADLPSEAEGEAAFELTDSQGRVIYQWGQVEGPTIRAIQPVAAPLGAWRLHSAMSDAVTLGAANWRNQLWLGLGAAGLLLGVLAFHLYRESSREVRLAGQRVSFVNQVSHELKTPLTNISLYAELASQQLPEDATHAKECLDVVTSESARLGRLIGNVLTFSKHQRGALQPRLAACDLSVTIRNIVDQFRPALEAKNVQMELHLPNLGEGRTDADMLGQILGNLLSNVEKYAANGKLEIHATMSGSLAALTIRDHGPGIPVPQQERIFAPFYRLSDKLSDGSTGTGIGLGIARDLARLLGGDLVAVTPPDGPGAQFNLTIKTA